MKYLNILIVFVSCLISSVVGQQDLLQYFIENPKELGWTLLYGRILQYRSFFLRDSIFHMLFKIPIDNCE